MTQLNVVRVLEQIDLADAAASRLLLYAGKIHGGKDGDEYRPTDQRVQQALEHWIALLQYDQSQPSLNHRMNEIMRESPQGGEPGPIRRLGVTGGAGGGGVQAVGYWEDTVAPEIPTATTIPTVDTLLKPPDAASPGQPGRPMRLPSVSNPVDPAIFNRLYRDTSGAK